MRISNYLILLSLMVTASLSAVEPTLTLIRKIPHSGYSEGLDFEKGYLWHALPKQLLKIDPADGTVLARFTPPSDYSESLQWFQGTLWNVSFSDNGIYAGTLKGNELKFVRKGSTPEVHAWGLTHNGKALIMTGDQSSTLYFVNPKTLKVERTITTSYSGLEDLAWDGKGIWTSTFQETRGKIFRIHPQTGKVEGTFLLPNAEECPVVDGIAYDGEALWVTGKECPSIYRLKKPLESELSPRSVTSKK